MKNHVLFALLPALLLGACGGNPAPTDTVETKTVNAYAVNGDALSEQGVFDLTKAQAYPMQLKFLNGGKYVPYIDFGGYLKSFDSTSERCVEEKVTAEAFSIAFENGESTFRCTIDAVQKEIRIGGDYRRAVEGEEGEPFDTSSNRLEGVFSESVISGDAQTMVTYSYAKTSFKTFEDGGAFYLPLGLANILVVPLARVQLFYDYENVYYLSGPTVLANLRIITKAGAEPVSITQKMSDSITDKVMPMDTREYHRDCYVFLFENYYGLRYSRNIKSMADYLMNTKYYADMVSENPAFRGEAYARFTLSLQDGHTVLTKNAVAWGETAASEEPQSIIETREMIEEYLSSAKKAAYEAEGLKPTDIRYSKDGKTAVIPLKSFASYEDAFDPKTKKQIVTDKEILAKDTYFQTRQYLETIKAKGGVERVIIDMAINEGGEAATMGKLLTLISKDNKSDMLMHDMGTGAVIKTQTRLDLNHDGKVDEKDETFGKFFKFYLLLSPGAFSCGTAYPFLASNQSIASVIGKKPGGGECALGQMILPSGALLAYSSLTRICWKDEKGTMTYDEGGVEPDEDFSLGEFYNLEKMAQTLVKSEQRDQPDDE